MSNSKTLLIVILAVVVGLPLVLGMAYFGIYNGLVSADVGVNQAWANVQSKLQRRYDLIPNLVETAKRYLSQEQLFLEIAEARSQWSQSLNNPVEQQIESASELEGVLSRLLFVMTTENYPTLESKEIMLSLMDELAGTENRISVERDRYNAAVGKYNRKIRSFPSSIVAGMAGFDKRQMFEASIGAQSPLTVDFG